MSEQSILEEPGVFVSTARVALDGKTYATGQLTSVAQRWQPADRSASLLLFVISATSLLVAVVGLPVQQQLFAEAGRLPMQEISFLLSLLGVWAALAAVAFAVGGWLTWRSAKGRFEMVLGVDSRDVAAVVSDDEEYVTRVTSAVLQAIALRG